MMYHISVVILRYVAGRMTSCRGPDAVRGPDFHDYVHHCSNFSMLQSAVGKRQWRRQDLVWGARAHDTKRVIFTG